MSIQLKTSGSVAPAADPIPPAGSAPQWITGGATAKAPRLILNAVEGFGKTTIGAHAPGAAVIMARGETGYETLLSAGRAPELPRIKADSWQSMMAAINALADNPGSVRTLVLDAMGGIERLCHEHVCDKEFGGDWSEKGFMSFMRGYDISVRTWNTLLAALDSLHLKGVGVIILSHITVKAFNNPIGASYDRYVSDCHPKTWAASHKWADFVGFGTFAQVLTKVDGKVKAKADAVAQRVIYTERSDAYDAKNRYGMPNPIELPNDHTQAWAAIAAQIPFYNKEAK